MNHIAHALRAEREFWDSLRGDLAPSSPMRSLATARATQHQLHAALQARLPVGEARELMPCEITAAEHAALFGPAGLDPWSDTLPMEHA